VSQLLGIDGEFDCGRQYQLDRHRDPYLSHGESTLNGEVVDGIGVLLSVFLGSHP